MGDFVEIFEFLAWKDSKPILKCFGKVFLRSQRSKHDLGWWNRWKINKISYSPPALKIVKIEFSMIIGRFYHTRACFDVGLRKKPLYEHFKMIFEPFPAKKPAFSTKSPMLPFHHLYMPTDHQGGFRSVLQYGPCFFSGLWLMAVYGYSFSGLRQKV